MAEKAEISEAIAENAVRWCSNILVEVLSNHARHLGDDARDSLRSAIDAVSKAMHPVGPGMNRGMYLWDVRVYPDGDAEHPGKVIRVEATTANDARLLALCVNGGWEPNGDMDLGAIELAYEWTDTPVRR